MKPEEQVVDAEFKEIEEAQPVEEAGQPEASEEDSIKTGILLGVTEDGRLFHRMIGGKEDTVLIHEVQGLLDYGKRVLDKRWNELV